MLEYQGYSQTQSPYQPPYQEQVPLLVLVHCLRGTTYRGRAGAGAGTGAGAGGIKNAVALSSNTNQNTVISSV